MIRRCALAVLTTALMTTGSTGQEPVVIVPVKAHALPLGVVTFPNGKAVNLTVGMGSGAFHHPAEAFGRVWLVSDRGPSIRCSDARQQIGLDANELCGGDERGLVLPLPRHVPVIYGVDIGADNIARVTVTIPLKGKSGKPITGMPGSARLARQPVFGPDGSPFDPDPSGIDAEALIKLSDGGFWIGEEHGPSLVHVQADGTIGKRWVALGEGPSFTGADFPVEEVLPAWLADPARNFTIEGLAISPDEVFLYALVQSRTADANPGDAEAQRKAVILQIERETGRVTAQFDYTFEHRGAFQRDSMSKLRAGTDVRGTELIALSAGKLLVVERLSRSAKFFTVELAKAEPAPVNGDQAGDNSVPRFTLRKQLLLDGDTVHGLPPRIVGLAKVSGRELVAVGDNNFGIAAAETRLVRVIFADQVLQ